jgi:hypothetical protein
MRLAGADEPGTIEVAVRTLNAAKQKLIWRAEPKIEIPKKGQPCAI